MLFPSLFPSSSPHTHSRFTIGSNHWLNFLTGSLMLYLYHFITLICANFTIYYIIKFLFCWDEVYVNLLLTFLIMLLVCSLTSRAEFPSANAVMDGFGGADLTISKLRHSQWWWDWFQSIMFCESMVWAASYLPISLVCKYDSALYLIPVDFEKF